LAKAFAVRALLTRLHRTVGLVTAGFLFIAGITGSLIAFWPELDVALNPELYRAASAGPHLSPSALAAKVEAAEPRLQVIGMPLRVAPGEAALLTVQPRNDPATGQPFALGYDEVFADPASGAMIGTRLWGACCFERKHLMPFLFTLHNTLYLPGRWGAWLMGTVALVWLLDCFVAIGLTFPRRQPFLSKWMSSFRLARGNVGVGRRTLDLHRVGGLWLWLALVPLAMSGVALNLDAELFRPLVRAVMPMSEPPPSRADASRAALGFDALGFDAIAARAAEEAAARNWPPPGAVFHNTGEGTYTVSMTRSQQDRGEGLGPASMMFDAATGALIRAVAPGEGRAGDVFMQVQFPLHSGRIAGLPGRILICVAGIVVAALSVTGLMMWSRRRRAQLRLRGV
jgi:uncharacterized iron-regulated membrane protein